jgi:hypothetical protein
MCKMQRKKKLVAVASLAVAPLIGGAAGVAVSALPAVAEATPASAHAATIAAHSTASSEPAMDGPADPQSEAPDPGENQTGADGPGGHEDPPGTNVDHQFSGVE